MCPGMDWPRRKRPRSQHFCRVGWMLDCIGGAPFLLKGGGLLYVMCHCVTCISVHLAISFALHAFAWTTSVCPAPNISGTPWKDGCYSCMQLYMASPPLNMSSHRLVFGLMMGYRTCHCITCIHVHLTNAVACIRVNNVNKMFMKNRESLLVVI